MSQSLVQLYVHLVFSCRLRRPFFQNVAFRDRTHRYLAGTCRRLDSPALKVGGVEDHVHLLCRMGKTTAVAELIRELKRSSSHWVKAQPGGSSEFYWQDGYGAFSVSPSDVDSVERYIANQVEHHRHESFQDEVRRLCRENGIEINEQYIWD